MLKAIIVGVFHLKHMFMLPINIILSYRTPTPVGVGGVFLCRVFSIRNKCVLFALKKKHMGYLHFLSLMRIMY